MIAPKGGSGGLMKPIIVEKKPETQAGPAENKALKKDQAAIQVDEEKSEAKKVKL